MMKNSGVPEEVATAELDAIRRLAALVSLPLVEEDVTHLAYSMRRVLVAVEPLLSTGNTLSPDPALFDPRR